MDTNQLDNKFASIGARLKLADRLNGRNQRIGGRVSFDVRTDRIGEYFELVRLPGVVAEVEVLDAQPADRHLLLLVRDASEKQKYLCGHDERHWFIAAIPETAPVGTVRQAMEALKPTDVQIAQAQKRVSAKARRRRKNAAYRRQGEWFFLPAFDLVVDEKSVLRNEPLTRGNGGKPHWAELCYRTDGETVYVCSKYPTGVTAVTYRQLLASNRNAKNWGWRTMQRNARVFVRGRIRHPDHRAIVLHGWHRVLMNTENQAKAMRNVAFLD
jgi:hypothetical protein